MQNKTYDLVKMLSQSYGHGENWSLNRIEENFEKIELDLDFQRRGPWGPENRQSYIKSVLTGKAATNITIVDIEKSLEHFQNLQKQLKNGEDVQDATQMEIDISIEYYSELKKSGKKYVSIDGNNRTTTIKMLMSGEIGLPEMKVKFNGSKQTSEIQEGTTLNQLRKGLQADGTRIRATTLESCVEFVDSLTKNFTIKYNILHRASRPHLNESFLNINEGEAINAQEKRNSVEGSVATQVRVWNKKYSDKLVDAGFFSESAVKRKAADEVMAQVLEAEMRGGSEDGKIHIQNITPKVLDNLFKETGNINKYATNADNMIGDIIDTFSQVEGKRHKKDAFIHVYIMLKKLNAEGFKKYNFEVLAKEFDKMMTLLNSVDDISYYQNHPIYKKSEQVKGGFNPFKGNEGTQNEIKEREQIIERYVKENLVNNLKIGKKETGKLKFETAMTKRVLRPNEEIVLDYEKMSEGTSHYMDSEVKIRLSDFHTFQRSTYLDTTVQREQSWNSVKEKAFVKSLVTGKVFTDIIVADASECAINQDDEYFRDITMSLEDMKEKLENLKIKRDSVAEEKRYEIDDKISTLSDIVLRAENDELVLPIKYVSLDGNNRSNAIKKFIEGKITFPSPLMVMDDGGNEKNIGDLSLSILEKRGTFTKIIEKIMQIEVGVTKLNRASKQDINTTFLMVNEGVPVNGQEKRNASGSLLSKDIRELSETYQCYFSKDVAKDELDWTRGWLEENDWKKRGDDLLITQLWGFEFLGPKIFRVLKEGHLDSMFVPDEQIRITEDFKKKLKLVFDGLGRNLPNQKIDKIILMNFYMFISNIYEAGIKLENKSVDEAYKFFVKKNNENDKKGEVFPYVDKDGQQKMTKIGFIYKDLTTKDKLFQREKIILSMSNGFVDELGTKSENKGRREVAKLAFDEIATMLGEHSYSSSDESLGKLSLTIRARLASMDPITKSYFYELATDSDLKLSKDTFINLENSSQPKLQIKAINMIINNEQATRDQILEVIESKNFDRDSDIIEKLTSEIANIYKDVLVDAQKSTQVEIKAWLLTFIRYDFEEFKNIITSEEITKIIREQSRIPYLEINTKIFEAINKRSITIKGSEDKRVIVPPFKINKNKIEYEKAGAGVPDVIYFPKHHVSKQIVGSSATSSDSLNRGNTQIMRHPRRLNELIMLLNSEYPGGVSNELIENLQSKDSKNEKIKSIKKRVIQTISKQEGGDAQELMEIIDLVGDANTDEEIKQRLEKQYKLNGNVDYLYLGHISQSVMGNKDVLDGGDVSAEEIDNAERISIDLFVYAQKNEITNNIPSNNTKAMHIQDVWFDYIYDNMVNVLSSSKKNITSNQNSHLSIREMSTLIIKDLVQVDLQSTRYLKFLASSDGKLTAPKRRLVEEAIYMALTYIDDERRAQRVDEEIENLLDIVSEIDTKKPNFSVEVHSNEMMRMINGITENVNSIKTRNVSDEITDLMFELSEKTQAKEIRGLVKLITDKKALFEVRKILKDSEEFGVVSEDNMKKIKSLSGDRKAGLIKK